MATTTRHPDYLRDVYERLAARSAANPDMDIATMRDVFERLHVATREPEGVSYAEVDAGGVWALWCIPPEASNDRVLVHMHGGGFMVCSMYTDRKLGGHIAKAVGARVLVLDFRLAPEHPFPARLEDSVGAYRWLLDDQRIEPGHIALVGHSAGGNLSTTTALKLRHDGVPLPAAILPVSPWYDMELRGDSFETNAATDAIVQRQILEGMLSAFLAGASPRNPLANPLHADLSGLPPTLIHTGGDETLVDDTLSFAQRAKQAGVDVEAHVVPGLQHSYPLLAGRDPRADETIARMAAWVRPKLGL